MHVRHLLLPLAAAWLLNGQTSYGEFYQYRNAQGVICFTDDLSKVPEKAVPKSKVYYDQFDEVPQQNDAAKPKEEELTREEKERGATVAVESEPASTHFTFADNKILVRVSIGVRNRTTTATLLLDTGASTTVIHESLARRMGLRNLAMGQASVAGGHTIDTGLTTAQFIALGPKRLENPTLTVISYHGGYSEYDGLLGMDFLKNFPHTIDTKNRRILWTK